METGYLVQRRRRSKAVPRDIFGNQTAPPNSSKNADKIPATPTPKPPVKPASIPPAKPPPKPAAKPPVKPPKELVKESIEAELEAVSYTHLTLPTICSV